MPAQPKGMPDLGDALQTVREGKKFGKLIREMMAQPRDVAEFDALIASEVAVVETYLRETNPGHAIDIAVEHEGYIGCVIQHWSVSVDVIAFHTEEVIVVGSKPRDRGEWRSAAEAVYEFVAMALALEPVPTG